jgi:hypothetical protein
MRWRARRGSTGTTCGLSSLSLLVGGIDGPVTCRGGMRDPAVFGSVLHVGMWQWQPAANEMQVPAVTRTA